MKCNNCNETDGKPDSCGYCGLQGCTVCLNLHEEDCDQNPDNAEVESQ